MASITPFKIAIPDNRIQHLKQKLALTDFPDEVLDTDDPWARGVPLSEIKRLTQYWEQSFDWRKAEAELNQFPQYTTKIAVDGFDTYDVHFIHQPSMATDAIPLLFIHGWPGSFIEVTKILPDLVRTEDGSPSFHMVAPSLVDFGFSSGNKTKGFNIDQHAEICHKLMLSLGYSSYAIQAGDLGYLIARFLSIKHGSAHIKATLLNNTIPLAPSATSPPEHHAQPLTPSDLRGLSRTEAFNTHGTGYLRLLSTKPQTIAYSLASSPAGLLAWIAEKLHAWSDAYPWTDDEILTWVSVAWFSTAGPGAAGRLYYEMEHRGGETAFAKAQQWADVPLGVVRFEGDVMLLPMGWNGTLGRVVRERVCERGGHFAAWERPDVLVGEMRRLFERGQDGGWGVCVDGKGKVD